MPAAAVIPALIAYIKVVAVKTLVAIINRETEGKVTNFIPSAWLESRAI